ncbi:MAG: class I SAM-dependent methyltransferase [Acidimicrobiales bacterium]
MTGPAQPLREQRLVFGEVAHVYDRRRPSYPAEVVDAVLGFAGLEQDTATPVVEVGAGTGKASMLFAGRGLRLTCLEPSPAMAAVARQNLAQFPNATVEELSFEDWRPQAAAYGLVFAAQSWHWVSPEARYSRAGMALAPGATLAVFWNVPAKSGDERLQGDLAAAYGDLLRSARWGTDRASRVEANNWVVGEIEASGLFEAGSPTIVRVPWRRSYDTESWLELLSTQSDHRMLDEQTRAALFERVRNALEHNGGRMEVEYVTVAYLARSHGGDR